MKTNFSLAAIAAAYLAMSAQAHHVPCTPEPIASEQIFEVYLGT